MTQQAPAYYEGLRTLLLDLYHDNVKAQSYIYANNCSELIYFCDLAIAEAQLSPQQLAKLESFTQAINYEC